MKDNFKYFLRVFLGLIFMALIFYLPEEAGLAAEAKIENIFYMSELREKEGIESLKKNADKIDILAPQFFTVTDGMKIAGKLDNPLKKVIKQKNLKVMPLVANAGFKQGVIHKLLTSPADQTAVITGLVYIAKKNNYIGWQFDFENISYLDKDLYSAFVEKAAEALHKNNLILSVAAVSRSVDYEDTSAFKNWSGVFDYARIAKAVDFISLMTYDDPKSVGPVASLPFINSVLDYVKDKIPPEKLSFGIPLYYWGWSVEPYKKITFSGIFSRISAIKSSYPNITGFNNDLGAAWLFYIYNNKFYMIWFQDKRGFKDKLDIISQNNFRGFSAWVLGVEDPGIWSALDKNIK